MKIKDLQIRQGKVDMTLEVVEKTEPREFEKFGKKGKVCNLTVKDDSGKIQMAVWNEDVDKVNEGDTIHLKNGWVGEWQGEPQLTTGKFGEIEVENNS